MCCVYWDVCLVVNHINLIITLATWQTTQWQTRPSVYQGEDITLATWQTNTVADPSLCVPRWGYYLSNMTDQHSGRPDPLCIKVRIFAPSTECDLHKKCLHFCLYPHRTRLKMLIKIFPIWHGYIHRHRGAVIINGYAGNIPFTVHSHKYVVEYKKLNSVFLESLLNIFHSFAIAIF